MAKANLEKEESVFSKNQLLQAKRFKEKTDILQAVLNEKENYTIEQAEKLINQFLQRRLK
ncbi:hypothetical protein [Scatolibacter rhodanostii]|uniref:hypothetical protein n=1 Tax=Scatolibacter rhodanostii TaxID=2014781 RepID=UPI000C06C050|nr:hypothetical protein [Scatolibacter rhodanostii]